MTALDRMDKLMFDPSMREWLMEHEIDLQRYLDYKINEIDHLSRIQLFLKRPLLGKAIVEDFSMDDESKRREALDIFFNMPGGLGVIMGQVGKGKTVLGLDILETAHDVYNKEVCMLSSNLDLPEYITQVEDIFAFKPDSVALIDEASLTAHARDSMTTFNKNLSKLLAIRRHQGLKLLFATQHSSWIDKNILRAAHFFFFKELPWDEVSSRNQDRGGGLDYMMMFIRMMMPTTVEQTLFTDGETWLSFSNNLPSFWSDEISKTYKKLSVHDVVKFIKNKHIAGMEHKILIKQLKIRGWDLEDIEIEFALTNPKQFIKGYDVKD